MLSLGYVSTGNIKNNTRTQDTSVVPIEVLVTGFCFFLHRFITGLYSL